MPGYTSGISVADANSMSTLPRATTAAKPITTLSASTSCEAVTDSHMPPPICSTMHCVTPTPTVNR